MQATAQSSMQQGRWPIQDLRSLASQLQESKRPCKSIYHYYPCTQAEINALALQVLRTTEENCQRDFPRLVLEIFRTVYLSGCWIAADDYKPIFQNFKERVLNILLERPTAATDALQKIEAGKAVIETMREGDSYLHCEIAYSPRKTLQLQFSLQQGSEPASSNPWELLALRLHILMETARMQSEQSYGAIFSRVGTQAAKKTGLGFLVPEPTSFEGIKFVKVTDHLYIGMDPHSSGPKKRYNGLPSDSVGAIQIVFRPGVDDAEKPCYRFYLHEPQSLTPEQLWDLREKIYEQFSKGIITLKTVIGICTTLLQPVPIASYNYVRFTDETTQAYFQTLIALCIQQQLARDKQFVSSLIAQCKSAPAKDTIFALDELYKRLA